MPNITDQSPSPERNEQGEYFVPPAAEKRATVLRSALDLLNNNARVRSLRVESVTSATTTEVTPEQLEQQNQTELSVTPAEDMVVPSSILDVETKHHITTADVVDLAEYAKRLAGQNEPIHPLVQVNQPTQRGLYDQEAA